MKKNKSGLTLIELLAVIAIISILFILLIPTINSAIEKARFTGVLNDMRNYEIAYRDMLMNGEGHERYEDIESKFNKYLDKELQFEDGVSKKISPFGKPYFFFFDNPYSKVYTINKDEIPREYSLTFENEKDGLNVVQRGFDEVRYGMPECDSPILDDGTYLYRVCNDKTTIIEYVGSATDVVIPEQIGGKDVIAISHTSSNNYNRYSFVAFERKGLTSVKLPSTLKFIGHGAFYENKLEEIIFPESIIFIGGYAFTHNDIKQVELPKKISSAERAVFEDNLLTNLYIPKNVKHIEFEAFHANPLIEVTLPSSFEGKIDNGNYSFYDYLEPKNPLPIFTFY